jgi:plastocyanin
VKLPYAATASAAFALAACATALAGSQAQPAESTPVTVHIKDFRFAPTPLHVRVGERVTFVNDDDEAHTVTASDAVAGAKFDSEGLDTSQTWQHVFAQAGTYRYFCELHPYMKGVVIVDAAPAGAR